MNTIGFPMALLKLTAIMNPRIANRNEMVKAFAPTIHSFGAFSNFSANSEINLGIFIFA